MRNEHTATPYRFDDGYKRVYEWDEKAQAYLFIGTYLALGITAQMSDKEKSKIVNYEMTMEASTNEK